MTVFDQFSALKTHANTYWGGRICAEIECAAKVSTKEGGAFDSVVEQAVGYLRRFMEENGAVTREAVLEAERLLMPAANAVKAYTIHCVAHAHIDMNWMWGFTETVSVTLDTFRTMLRLMDEYPKFTFSQSQASTYRIAQQYDPELFEEIKGRVKEGRWEVAASTWVESDKNMPNGESFARHALYTKRYFQKEFGLAPDSLALDFEPDTFGHNRNLPEILSKSGVKYYFHFRAYDGHFVYRWRAPSGAEVLVFRDPKNYNATISCECLPFSVQFCVDAGLQDMLYVYGVGDHGGGPTRRDIERLLDMASWPCAPVVKFSTYAAFYARLEQIRGQLPVVDQELNFVFTGCYTTQTRIKKANRIAEDRLYDAETLSAEAVVFAGGKDYKDSFFCAWEKTLFNQFHDILPGSGVIETREYALGEFQKAMAIAITRAKNGMAQIAEQIDTSDIVLDADKLTISEGGGVGYGVGEPYGSGFPQTERGRGRTRILHLFNPTEFDRVGPVRVVLWDWDYDVKRLCVRDAYGKTVTHELLEQGSGFGYWGHLQTVLLIYVKIPAFGYNTYVVTEESATESEQYRYLEHTADSVTDGEKVLENEYVKAVFKSGDMRLVSFVDKVTGRDWVSGAGPSCGFRLIMEDTVNGMTAWRVGSYTRIIELNETANVVVYEQRYGALRKSIKYKLAFGRSSLDVEVSLDKDSRLLRFSAMADWHELGDVQFVPQLSFYVPFGFDAPQYRYDIPFGTIDRGPINGDTPGNRFILALPDDPQISPLLLVTDSKYGYRGVNNSVSVDLIRSATEPDPSPEDGIHRMEIGVGIMKTRDNRAVFEVVNTFTHPVDFVSGSAHKGMLPKEFGFLKVGGDAKVSAVKTAEDGGLIVRVYDANGHGSEVSVKFSRPVRRAVLTDLTELKELGTAQVEDSCVHFKLGACQVATLRVQWADE